MTKFRHLAAVLAALSLLFAACGDDDDAAAPDDTADAPDDSGDAAADPGEVAEGPVTIAIVDFDYDPKAITVAPGTEITFVNQDSTPHTATARDTTSFNTDSIDGGGAEGTITIADDASGEIVYFCSFHPFMEATVTVAG